MKAIQLQLGFLEQFTASFKDCYRSLSNCTTQHLLSCTSLAGCGTFASRICWLLLEFIFASIQAIFPTLPNQNITATAFMLKSWQVMCVCVCLLYFPIKCFLLVFLKRYLWWLWPKEPNELHLHTALVFQLALAHPGVALPTEVKLKDLVFMSSCLAVVQGCL